MQIKCTPEGSSAPLSLCCIAFACSCFFDNLRDLILHGRQVMRHHALYMLLSTTSAGRDPLTCRMPTQKDSSAASLFMSMVEGLYTWAQAGQLMWNCEQQGVRLPAL